MQALKVHVTRFAPQLLLVGLAVVYVASSTTLRDVFVVGMTLAVAGLVLTAAQTDTGSKTFARWGAGVLVVTLAGVAAFNYVVNPFGLYATQYFEPIAFGTRNYKMDLYATADPRPEAIILGSSRTFTVAPTQIRALWGLETVNLSYPSGAMRDDLAMMRFIAEGGEMPKLIIISLSPERFATIDYRVLEPDARLWDYLDDNSVVANLKTHFDRWTRLFSKEQIDASLRVVQAEIVGRPAVNLYFDADGMGHFDEREPTEGDFTMEALRENSWTLLFTEADNPNMATDGLARFERILKIAEAHNTVVIGYIPPVHPRFQAYLDANTDFAAITTRLKAALDGLTAAYPSFQYSDFLRSEAFSDGQRLFYDIMHPTIEASALMMEMLHKQYGQ
ncbi:MAG: hypothetical protein JNJ78_16895 [Anaerolineae bacterium]|nr:hypothetical protein [Anaerolineae bacterium]